MANAKGLALASMLVMAPGFALANDVPCDGNMDYGTIAIPSNKHLAMQFLFQDYSLRVRSVVGPDKLTIFDASDDYEHQAGSMSEERDISDYLNPVGDTKILIDTFVRGVGQHDEQGFFRSRVAFGYLEANGTFRSVRELSPKGKIVGNRFYCTQITIHRAG